MTANFDSSGLQSFLSQSPTPFHAVKTISQRLLEAGFIELLEANSWQLKTGGKYFVTRNESSIVAFIYGESSLLDSGLKMMGAHTDSPCLKVKPHPEIVNKGYFQLGVEVYGGALLNPWFDRDLSLAGRVTCKTRDGALVNELIDFKKPIAVIPSLAIHLDREANTNRTVNAQKDIPPILWQVAEKDKKSGKPDFRKVLLQQIQNSSVVEVLDFELSFYDTQSPAVVGFNDEFFASARLDNLLSCYLGMEALLQADVSQSCVLVLSDHEEVGSASHCGAQGPFLESVLQRWLGDSETKTRVLDRSVLISVDNAHGIHPNYADRHDGNHGPLLNAGPVIKVNANQRYATSSETAAMFRDLCQSNDVPVQTFVARTDMGCGSTIGPITSSEIGVKTLDVGVPTFAMHSIRETAGVNDAGYLLKVLSAFFKS